MFSAMLGFVAMGFCVGLGFKLCSVLTEKLAMLWEERKLRKEGIIV